jgi:hypothetical protein
MQQVCDFHITKLPKLGQMVRLPPLARHHCAFIISFEMELLNFTITTCIQLDRQKLVQFMPPFQTIGSAGATIEDDSANKQSQGVQALTDRRYRASCSKLFTSLLGAGSQPKIIEQIIRKTCTRYQSIRSLSNQYLKKGFISTNERSSKK